MLASSRRDAQNEPDGAGLRSSVAAATPSQLRSSTTTYSTQLVVFVVSLLEVLQAAPRGGTRRHLEGGRELRTASAPSQQHQLRRRLAAAVASNGSVPRPLGSPSNGQPLDGFATFLPP